MELLLPEPALVWGVFVRSLGLVYLITFAGLLHQVVALVGTRGVSPIEPLLARIREDFPNHLSISQA